MKSNEVMIISGVPIRFRNRSRIELHAQARFLFGKQVMPPGTDNTPARRIYYAVQTAYVGNEQERPPAREAAQRLCDEFAEATTSQTVVKILADVMRAVDEDRCYEALKMVQRVMRHEEAVLPQPPSHHSVIEVDAAE